METITVPAKSEYISYTVIGYTDGTVDYFLIDPLKYWSPRFNNYISVEAGFRSDGASGAVDVKGSRSWWVHDKVCERPEFDDGTPITAWQAARIISDLLAWESKIIKGPKKYLRRTRSLTWFWATFFFGCRRARRNGWFRSSPLHGKDY